MRRFVVPEGRATRRSARGSWTCRRRRRRCRPPAARPQGTVYVTDEPDAIIKKFKSAVTDSGREIRYSDRTRPGSATCWRSWRSRAAARSPSSSGSSRAPATATSSSPSARPWSTTWRRCASATRRCAPTSRGSSGCSRMGAEKARAIAAQTMPTCARAMGVGPVALAARPPLVPTPRMSLFRH